MNDFKQIGLFDIPVPNDPKTVEQIYQWAREYFPDMGFTFYTDVLGRMEVRSKDFPSGEHKKTHISLKPITLKGGREHLLFEWESNDHCSGHSFSSNGIKEIENAIRRKINE